MRNPLRNPAHHRSRRIMSPPMAGHARTQSRGSTRTAITTKARRTMLNYQTYFTSKESWPDATASTEWARTIKATASPGEILLLTTATWRANTGQDDRSARGYSPTRDLRYSRDRRSLQTSSTIFIRPSRLRGCIGLRLCQQKGSVSVRTERRQRCR